MKILLVEDDETIIAVLTKSLAAQHYAVDAVTDGETGWTYATTFDYSLIVLDVLLPKLDGIRFCQRFRAAGYSTPILFLTAQDSSAAKVRGLDAGADDYVVKPFDLAELVARIRALLRRGCTNPAPVLSFGDLCLKPSTCEVTYAGHLLNLTAKEYELLELFLRDCHYVFSADEILDGLWSSEEFPAEATVRSHIRRLRQKLETAGAPHDLIATVHGRGYCLRSPQAEETAAEATGEEASQTVERADSVDSQTAYLAFLNQTWATTQSQSLDQVAILAEATHALQMDWLSDQKREQAQQVAHTLTGTLGIFGLQSGVHLARELEYLFNASMALEAQDALYVETLVTALHEEIQNKQTIQRADLPPEHPPLSQTELATGVKVMIVDDDPAWLRALPQLLHPWGFQLTTLADPEHFWPVLTAIDPDLLVLEINLQQMNGLNLCQALRQDPHWQRLAVVCLSNSSSPRLQQQAFMMGADDYLCKPVSGFDLANRILNRLQRVRAWMS